MADFLLMCILNGDFKPDSVEISSFCVYYYEKAVAARCKSWLLEPTLDISELLDKSESLFCLFGIDIVALGG